MSRDDLRILFSRFCTICPGKKKEQFYVEDFIVISNRISNAPGSLFVKVTYIKGGKVVETQSLSDLDDQLLLCSDHGKRISEI